MPCCKKKQKAPKGDFRTLKINFFSPNIEHQLKSTPQGEARILSHATTCKETRKLKTSPYPENRTKTSKYNLVSFFPLAIFYHFSKYTNIYFLIVMAIQLIPGLSPFTIDSIISPVIFVTIVSLIREGIDDYGRHKSDFKSNSSECVYLPLDREAKKVVVKCKMNQT
jgi:magnesium-transporting ATPase (P-type)